MSDFFLLAAALAKQPACPPPTKPPLSQIVTFGSTALRNPQPLETQKVGTVRPEPPCNSIEFSQPVATTPRSGPQLYQQRLAALRSGRLYTRLPLNSFRESWLTTTQSPTYEQWRKLLTLEARAVTRGQGGNRLAILLGDSLSLWFPSDRLPSEQLWLNQGVSGDTTQQILHRLPAFKQTRPSTIYVMAGVNDLKQGVTDNEILWNFQRIVGSLKQAHPQAKIIIQSILPTRSATISNQRIQALNQRLAAIALRTGALYVDLYPQFLDETGQLQPAFTTDGLHLSSDGYETWRLALKQIEAQLAQSEI